MNRDDWRHICYGAEVGVQSTRRARGEGPTDSCAFADAIVYTIPERALRLLPLGASEAAGSPTALLYPRKNVGISKAVWRWNM